MGVYGELKSRNRSPDQFYSEMIDYRKSVDSKVSRLRQQSMRDLCEMPSKHRNDISYLNHEGSVSQFNNTQTKANGEQKQEKAYDRLYNLAKKRSLNASVNKVDPNQLSPARTSLLRRKRSNPEFELISRLYDDAFKREEQAKNNRKQEYERYRNEIRRSISPPNKTSQNINSKCI